MELKIQHLPLLRLKEIYQQDLQKKKSWPTRTEETLQTSIELYERNRLVKYETILDQVQELPKETIVNIVNILEGKIVAANAKLDKFVATHAKILASKHRKKSNSEHFENRLSEAMNKSKPDFMAANLKQADEIIANASCAKDLLRVELCEVVEIQKKLRAKIYAMVAERERRISYLKKLAALQKSKCDEPKKIIAINLKELVEKKQLIRKLTEALKEERILKPVVDLMAIRNNYVDMETNELREAEMDIS